MKSKPCEKDDHARCFRLSCTCDCHARATERVKRDDDPPRNKFIAVHNLRAS